MTGDLFHSFLGSWFGRAVTLALAALGAYLLWNHTGHIAWALPYLFLLACPLLHFLGHGHRHHGHGRHEEVQK